MSLVAISPDLIDTRPVAAKLQPFVFPEAPMGPLSVRDLMRLPVFDGARVLCGAHGLAHNVARVNVMQIPTADFARPDELVLATTTAFERAMAGLDTLMDELAGRGVAALAAHRQALSNLGPGPVSAAERHALPLIELAERARLNVVLRDVLERLVAEQTTRLEEDRLVRDHLAGFALAGSGIEELPLAIGELTGRPVAVVDRDGRVLATSDDATGARAARLAGRWLAGETDAPADGGNGWVVWPVQGPNGRLGCIVALLPCPPEPAHRAILEHGSTSAALAILQLNTAAAETTRLREQFVHDLLGGALEPDAVRERAELLGWDPEGAYRVIVASDDKEGGAVVDRVRRRLAGALAVQQAARCLAIIGAPAVPQTEIDETVARLAHGLAAEDRVLVGISGAHRGASALGRAVREADEMLGTARCFPRETVRWFDPMDPLRILALVPRSELLAFADHALARLDDAESERRETLLVTLEALIATDLNVAATARKGGWHYNTVRYRIKRLSELLGPFIEDGARLQTLALALLIRRELVGNAGLTRAKP
jgi:purine catabolism regulator